MTDSARHERRRVVVDPNAPPPLPTVQVVHPAGERLPLLGDKEDVNLNRFGLSLRPPLASAVPEVPHQLLPIRISRDHRWMTVLVVGHLGIQVPEWASRSGRRVFSRIHRITWWRGPTAVALANASRSTTRFGSFRTVGLQTSPLIRWTLSGSRRSPDQTSRSPGKSHRVGETGGPRDETARSGRRNKPLFRPVMTGSFDEFRGEGA